VTKEGLIQIRATNNPWRPNELFPDENKYARKQSQEAENDERCGNGKRCGNAVDDKKDRKQQHSEILGEVHGSSFGIEAVSVTTLITGRGQRV
jgi:hypothetical protein